MDEPKEALKGELEKAVGCECVMWARTGQPFYARHNPSCQHYDPEGDAAKIIKDLLKGMRAWAADEDGVHPEACDAYDNAADSVWESRLTNGPDDFKIPVAPTQRAGDPPTTEDEDNIKVFPDRPCDVCGQRTIIAEIDAIGELLTGRGIEELYICKECAQKIVEVLT